MPQVDGEKLLQWYAKNARVLPWRGSREPYPVLVSEIMLQQTRVEAVLPHYLHFMASLPDVQSLALLPAEELNKLWEGLGYYSRARNLQKAARQIVERGAFPQTKEALLTLCGVGEYTAGAVASIAFGERCAAVDGNVLRICARITLDQTPLPSPAMNRSAERFVLDTLPQDADAGIFNQALMDLGATICTPRSPKCDICPWRDGCKGYASGAPELLPIRSEKPPKQEESFAVYLFVKDGRVLVRKRPAKGMLAGLWEFPHHLAGAYQGEPVTAHKHVFTHRVWQMQAYLCADAPLPDDTANAQWVDAQALAALAFPSAMEPFRAWLFRNLLRAEQ